MHWIYLSPHLDDVVLSAGGLVWEQVQSGQTVAIWTICAGDPPPPPYTPFAEELHQRWKTDGTSASAVRRTEDSAACRVLGAHSRHSAIPDCIYRRIPGSDAPLIAERDDLFRPYPAAEGARIAEIAEWIRAALPPDARLVSPMALGGHIDHQLVRAAAESLNRPVWYYPDYPYVVNDPLHHTDLRDQIAAYQPGLTQTLSEQGMSAWQAAVAAYASQISTFWGSLDEMRSRIAAYRREGGGLTLWTSSL